MVSGAVFAAFTAPPLIIYVTPVNVVLGASKTAKNHAD